MSDRGDQIDEEWFLPMPDAAGELYVRELGKGEPLVVLHGGFARGQHASLLEPLRALADRYRLVFYDQRGSARSPVSPSDYSLHGHIADLERLRNELAVDRLNLLGHSAGGNIAMAYLEQYPDKVAELVLLSPSPPISVAARAATEQPERQAFLRFVHRPAVGDELARHGLNGEVTGQDARARTRLWRIRFAAANCYHIERWPAIPLAGVYFNRPTPTLTDAPDSWDYAEALAHRTQATHVILGDHDTVDITGRRWKTIAQRITGLQLHVIHHAGHFTWIDEPIKFQQHINAALKH